MGQNGCMQKRLPVAPFQFTHIMFLLVSVLWMHKPLAAHSVTVLLQVHIGMHHIGGSLLL